jgi:hypothetical protein
VAQRLSGADDLLSQMGKNVLALKTLISLAHGMGGILGTAWPLVLQTLETLYSIIHPASAKSLAASGN